MKNTALVLFSLFFLLSCGKEEDTRPDCQKQSVSYLVVSNNSQHPYDIYIGNTYKMRVEPRTVTAQIPITKTPSKTLIEARQASGYTTTPKTIEFLEYLTICSAYSIQIP
jgi:hypothetical protein